MAPGQRAPFVSQRGEVAADGDDDLLAFEAAGKGDDMMGLRPGDSDRLIVAAREQFGEVAPDGEQLPRQRQLDAGRPANAWRALPSRDCPTPAPACARGEIDRAAIVRVDQREVP